LGEKGSLRPASDGRPGICFCVKKDDKDPRARLAPAGKEKDGNQGFDRRWSSVVVSSQVGHVRGLEVTLSWEEEHGFSVVNFSRVGECGGLSRRHCVDLTAASTSGGSAAMDEVDVRKVTVNTPEGTGLELSK